MGTKLQTIVPIAEGEPKIDYHSQLLLLGSCFSENIGDKLEYYKFTSWSNPFGIIFNPYSLEQLLCRTIEDFPFEKKDLVEREGVWRSFEVHSQWQRASPESLLADLNEQRKKLKEYLQDATHCIITLGTAWVYRYKTTHNWVANCHKVPGTEFEKELMEVEAIAESLRKMVGLLERIHPNIKVIFTLSPVRHIKDGFTENNRSKGRLLDGIHTAVESTKAVYFPSYEIMMDELRDYRFYADDLLHPSSLAVAYIWEKFQQTWIDPSLASTMEKIQAVQKALAHRPMNPKQKNSKDFSEKLRRKIEEVRSLIPNIEF